MNPGLLTLLGLGLLATCFATQAAEKFPKPNPTAMFPELKVYSTPGDPIRIPKEDWSRARLRCQTDPEWRPWFQEKEAEVRDWMAKRRDRTNWIAGWWHDFVSPKDGSFLTWSPEEPGPNTLSSPSDPKVALTPKIHGGWVFVFRGRHAEKMMEAALLYRLTGEKAFADWAMSQLDFYAENYENWPIQTSKSKSRLTHQSLDEAVNLVKYINAARYLGDAVSAERKAKWTRLLFKPEAELLEETLQRIHNIACWQRSAVAHVALYCHDSELWNRAINGPFGIRRQLTDGVTSEYFWFEQSLTYNNYVVQALLPLFKYAALEGKAQELSHEMAVLQNLMLAPLYIRFPNSQCPNPADSTGGLPRAPHLGLYASAARILPTSAGLEQRPKNWETLLDPLPPAKSRPLPEPKTWHLETTRSALLKNEHWQIFFHYGQVDGSHAQSEALNFEAFWNDVDLSHDPGTVGYGSPLLREYYTTGLAHNVPLIDGLGQERWHPGECVVFDAAKPRIVARQPQYRRDVSVERELLLDGGALIDRVQVRASETRRIGLLLHLQAEVELPPSFQPAPHEKFAPGLKHWSDLKSAPATGPSAFLIKTGGKSFRLTVKGGFESGGRIVHGNAPDLPPKRRDALYFEATPGSDCHFETMLEPIAP